MLNLSDNEKRDVIKFLEAGKPLPEKYRFLLFGDAREVELADLTKRIIALRDARDWKQFHNPKDLALSLVLEASEVMEHFQWKDKAEMVSYVVDHKEDIGEELADVLYWVLLMSQDLDIDVVDALDRKIMKIENKYPVDKAKGNAKKYTELEKL